MLRGTANSVFISFVGDLSGRSVIFIYLHTYSSTEWSKSGLGVHNLHLLDSVHAENLKTLSL